MWANDRKSPQFKIADTGFVRPVRRATTGIVLRAGADQQLDENQVQFVADRITKLNGIGDEDFSFNQNNPIVMNRLQCCLKFSGQLPMAWSIHAPSRNNPHSQEAAYELIMVSIDTKVNCGQIGTKPVLSAVQKS